MSTENTDLQQPRLTEADERLWATFCHLSSFVWVVGVPLGNIFGPLFIWLIKRNESSFVDEQGAESLNFQISISFYAIVLLLCGLIVGVTLTALGKPYVIFGVPILLVGIFSLPVLFLVDILAVIVAAVKANHGEHFRYPLTIRLF